MGAKGGYEEQGLPLEVTQHLVERATEVAQERTALASSLLSVFFWSESKPEHFAAQPHLHGVSEACAKLETKPHSAENQMAYADG